MSVDFEVVKSSPPIVFIGTIPTFYLPVGISHRRELDLIRSYLEFHCPDPFPTHVTILYPEKSFSYCSYYFKEGPVLRLSKYHPIWKYSDFCLSSLPYFNGSWRSKLCL